MHQRTQHRRADLLIWAIVLLLALRAGMLLAEVL